MSHPGLLSGGLLLRPMVPLVPDPLPPLHQVRVLIAGGREDLEAGERWMAAATMPG